jgi:hypothetical protein
MEEIRSTKHEIRKSMNVQNTNVPNKQRVLNIELEILDLFRVSIFEFRI